MDLSSSSIYSRSTTCICSTQGLASILGLTSPLKVPCLKQDRPSLKHSGSLVVCVCCVLCFCECVHVQRSAGMFNYTWFHYLDDFTAMRATRLNIIWGRILWIWNPVKSANSNAGADLHNGSVWLSCSRKFDLKKACSQLCARHPPHFIVLSSTIDYIKLFSHRWVRTLKVSHQLGKKEPWRSKGCSSYLDCLGDLHILRFHERNWGSASLLPVHKKIKGLK